MVTIREPACFGCERLIGWPTCEAFPDGIPAVVRDGEHDHRTPLPGDNGLRFLPLEPRSDEKGGPGSGNFGHSGRPGKVGGSAPGDGNGQPLSPKGSTGALDRNLNRLRPALARAAQKIYDEWTPDADDEYGDPELGGGGICDRVAEALGDVILSKGRGVDITPGGQEGDDHAFIIVYNQREAWAVDIPPGVYEYGGGYNWQKRKGVTIQPEDVLIYEVDREYLDKGLDYTQPEPPSSVVEERPIAGSEHMAYRVRQGAGNWQDLAADTKIGGPGSGFRGHAGRPGEVGGSRPASAGGLSLPALRRVVTPTNPEFLARYGGDMPAARNAARLFHRRQRTMDGIDAVANTLARDEYRDQMQPVAFHIVTDWFSLDEYRRRRIPLTRQECEILNANPIRNNGVPDIGNPNWPVVRAGDPPSPGQTSWLESNWWTAIARRYESLAGKESPVFDPDGLLRAARFDPEDIEAAFALPGMDAEIIVKLGHLDVRVVARYYQDKSNGERVDTGEIDISYDSQNDSCHYNLIRFKKAQQSRGDISAFLARHEEMLINGGYKETSLFADITIGRYAWARMGFDYRHSREASITNDRFKRWVRGINLGGKFVEEGGKIPWPTFKTAQDVANYDNGLRVAGSQILNRDVSPDAQLALGKAFMLDTSRYGHDSWDGVKRLRAQGTKAIVNTGEGDDMVIALVPSMGDAGKLQDFPLVVPDAAAGEGRSDLWFWQDLLDEEAQVESTKGGPGSGFRGHAGRPGRVGGSAPSQMHSEPTPAYNPSATPMTSRGSEMFGAVAAVARERSVEDVRRWRAMDFDHKWDLHETDEAEYERLLQLEKDFFAPAPAHLEPIISQAQTKRLLLRMADPLLSDKTLARPPTKANFLAWYFQKYSIVVGTNLSGPSAVRYAAAIQAVADQHAFTGGFFIVGTDAAWRKQGDHGATWDAAYLVMNLPQRGMGIDDTGYFKEVFAHEYGHLLDSDVLGKNRVENKEAYSADAGRRVIAIRDSDDADWFTSHADMEQELGFSKEPVAGWSRYEEYESRAASAWYRDPTRANHIGYKDHNPHEMMAVMYEAYIVSEGNMEKISRWGSFSPAEVAWFSHYVKPRLAALSAKGDAGGK